MAADVGGEKKKNAWSISNVPNSRHRFGVRTIGLKGPKGTGKKSFETGGFGGYGMERIHGRSLGAAENMRPAGSRGVQAQGTAKN